MGHDLAINTAQLQSHATEVDACATTIESAQNIAAGTQNQVSQNAFGLMFLPYAAVAHFGIKNLSAMMKDISEAEHRLAVCLRQLAAEMDAAEEKGVEEPKKIQDDMDDPTCGTGSGGGGTGPGGGGGSFGGGGGGFGGGGATGGGGGASLPTPPGGDGSLDDKDKDEKKEDDLASLLSGNDKISVTDDELRAFLEKQREDENDDLKTFYERQKEDQAKALERYTEAHPGEDVSEVKSLIEQNQQEQQDAMTDFLAKQRTDEEAQIREFVKDNPTATSREFDTFMSKQRTDQQASYRTFVEEQQKAQNTRIEEFTKSHPDSKPEDVKSLFEKQDQHGDQDIDTFLNRQRQDEERSLRRFIFEGVKK